MRTLAPSDAGFAFSDIRNEGLGGVGRLDSIVLLGARAQGTSDSAHHSETSLNACVIAEERRQRGQCSVTPARRHPHTLAEAALADVLTRYIRHVNRLARCSMVFIFVGACVLALLFVAFARSGAPPAVNIKPAGPPRPPPVTHQRTLLTELLEVPPDQRDEAWASHLRVLLPLANYELFGSTEAAGAIGARCLQARLTARCPGSLTFDEMLAAATEQGLGVVLSTTTSGLKTEVRFGALATLRMFGNWRAPGLWSGAPAPEGLTQIKEATEVMFAAPNFEYLPEFVRSALRVHLAAVGVLEPRVMLVYWPSQERRDLVFSVYPELFGSRDEYQAQMHAIIWYLPDGYQILTAATMAKYIGYAVPL